MNTSGDAAEQVVRLSLEGIDVAARLTGSAAKNIAILLMAALKDEGKTQGKTRLTNMIKSGKELKVFSIPQKDLKKFTEHAKKYGVLYTVLRDKESKNPNAPVDIISRAEDASKIQRIVERFGIGKEEKAQIISQSQHDISQREAKGKETQKEKPDETIGDIFVDQAVGKETNVKEKESHKNPSLASAEKKNLSEEDSKKYILANNSKEERPSVREKLEMYKQEVKEQKDKAQKSRDKEIPKSKGKKTKHNSKKERGR